jgi:tetratricopeptide (TPR) repeat protein
VSSAPPLTNSDSLLDSAVALLDDLLAAGVSPGDLDLSALPEGVRVGVAERLSCLLKLRACAGPDHPTPPPDRTPTDAPADGECVAPRPFGRFAIERELGRGGYGIVYLAHDPRLGRPVALKVPRREVLLDPAGRDRLRHEARAAALLDHPNIVPVYEAGTVGPVWYVVSAYCPGVSLGEWLADRAAPVPPRDAAQLVATIADAVQHAHARGILHRDLKPSNILLSGVRGQESGVSNDAALIPDPSLLTSDSCLLTPKVADFGLSKILAAGDGAATQSGAVVGTPLYMAPEQAEGRVKDITAMTDVWALGVILYELLTSETPFRADTPLQVLRRVTSESLVSPRALRPDVPRDLEAVCLKCLEKNPARRYPTAAELAAELRRFVAGEPVRARRPGAVERARRWTARHPARALAAALVVLLPTVAALGFGWHNRKLSAALTAADAAKTEASLRQDEAEGHRQALVMTVDEVIAELDDLVRDLPQTDVGRKAVYDRAARMAEGLRKAEADNPGLRRSVGRVYLSLAAIASMVGDFPAAARALDQAEPAVREWADAAPNDPDVQHRLVNLIRARWYLADQQRDPRALAYARDVEERTTVLAVRFPNLVYLQNWRANALVAVANAEAAADPPPAACGDRYRQAIDVFRALEPRVKKDNPEIRFERAVATLQYGDYFRSAGKPAEAMTAYRDVLDLLADTDWYPAPRPHHRFHKALALRRWGGVLFELGEAGRAIEQLTESADILRALTTDSPQTGDYAAFRLDAVAERALARWAAGRAGEARADAEEVVRKLPSVGRRRLWRAKGLWVLGESARLQGDGAKARERFTEALAGGDNPTPGAEVREWQHVCALVRLSLGDLARAESNRSAAEEHDRAADDLLAKLTAAHPELPRYARLKSTAAARLREGQ